MASVVDRFNKHPLVFGVSLVLLGGGAGWWLKEQFVLLPPPPPVPRVEEAAAVGLATAARVMIGEALGMAGKSTERDATIRQVLDALAKVTPEGDGEAVQREYRTAAYYCLQSGRDRVDWLRLLMDLQVSKGKKVSHFRDFEWGETTFVHEAAATGSIECLRFLVKELGWSANFKAPMGSSKELRSPLDHLVLTGLSRGWLKSKDGDIEHPDLPNVQKCLKFLRDG